MPRWFPAVLAGLMDVALAQDRRPDGERLRSVEFQREDVFSDERAAGNLFYGLANLLHAVTLEEVIAREVWLRPGDRVTAADAAEIERNLRGLGLFGEVRTELRPAGDGTSDLVIHTRDQFSLSASISLSHVGGVNKVALRLSEGNLFGTGKGVAAVASREGDDETRYLRYTDPQLFGSRHFLEVQSGNTDEGAFTNVTLSRPLRRLEDDLTYGAFFQKEDQDVDYYYNGESVAEVPVDRHYLRLFAAAVDGPRELREAHGVDLQLSRQDYEPAFGPAAGNVHVPGDTDYVELGSYWTVDWRPRFDVVQRLDAIDYDEDLELGIHWGVRAAGRWRAEEGVDAALQPVLGLDGRAAFTPADRAYVTLATSSTARFDGDLLAGWRVSGAAHAFFLGLPAQTLASSITFDAVDERQDLMPQLTLGEDNGLRGYPARAYAGTRMARLNLEDRIDSGIEILSVQVGAAAFCDVGWMHDASTGRSLSSPLRSVGVGLRLGGSHLFGRKVLRIDCSWPLDDQATFGSGVSLSFAVGQVFTFFGNATELGREF